MEERTDGELVARILAGDRHAFTEVLRRHDERLRGLAWKLLGGDPHRMDDALQDAYVRAYRALPRFRQDADLGSWLYRITYNACIDELRRAKRPPEPVDTAAPTTTAPAPARAPIEPLSPPTPSSGRSPSSPRSNGSPSCSSTARATTT